MKPYLKSICFLISSFVCLGVISIGCKNTSDPLGHQGPFDVPTNTFTVTNTPTATSTPGLVNVNCVINYINTQNGVNWNLVDPNGNTVNAGLQVSGTPFAFTPTNFGIYSINIPTQTRYLYSSQSLTIKSPGNYSATFSCSGQTLTASPNTINYSTAIGYQIPATISYSYTGNLNVPVTLNMTGLNTAFSASPNSGITLTNSAPSTTLNISKNSFYISNTSLNLSANDLLGNSSGANVAINIDRGYSIPVTFYWSVANFGYVNGGIGSNPVSAVYTFSVNDSDLGNSASYSYQTTFQPSDGPNPVTYSGNFSYLNSSSVTVVSDSAAESSYFNGTGVTFTLPDGSTRSCSGCVTFTSGTPVPNDPIITTSY